MVEDGPMLQSFDPYLDWLGIRSRQRPPNHYRLLGVPLMETDPHKIAQAAAERIARVREHLGGPHAATAARLVRELESAAAALTDPYQRAPYDAALQSQLAPPSPSASSETGVERPLPPSVGRPAAGPGAPLAPGQARRSRRRKVLGIAIAIAVGGLLGAAIYTLVNAVSTSDDEPVATANGDPAIDPFGDGDTLAPPSVASPSTDQPPPPATDGDDVEPPDSPPDENGEPSPPAPTDVPRADVVPTTPPPWAIVVDAASVPSPPAPREVVSTQTETRLRSVRQALAQRNLNQAARLLATADDVVRTTADRAAVEQMLCVHRYLAAFWRSVESAAAALQPGQSIAVRGVQVIVVQRDGDQLVLRTDDREKAFSIALGQIQGELAIGLADRGFQASGAHPTAPIAAFLLIDRDGAPARGRFVAQWAFRQGMAVDALLSLPE